MDTCIPATQGDGRLSSHLFQKPQGSISASHTALSSQEKQQRPSQLHSSCLPFVIEYRLIAVCNPLWVFGASSIVEETRDLSYLWKALTIIPNSLTELSLLVSWHMYTLGSQKFEWSIVIYIYQKQLQHSKIILNQKLSHLNNTTQQWSYTAKLAGIWYSTKL